MSWRLKHRKQPKEPKEPKDPKGPHRVSTDLLDIHGRVWVDALICGKTFVASAECRQIERLLASLRKDVATYGRDAMLDMYRQCFVDCHEMQHDKFALMSQDDKESFAWDVVFLNALRSVLHDVALTIYEAKPQQDELQQPQLVKAS